jgi:hypothetical protein
MTDHKIKLQLPIKVVLPKIVGITMSIMDIILAIVVLIGFCVTMIGFVIVYRKIRSGFKTHGAVNSRPPGIYG